MLLGVPLCALFRVIIIRCVGNLFSEDCSKTTDEDTTKSKSAEEIKLILYCTLFYNGFKPTVFVLQQIDGFIIIPKILDNNVKLHGGK
ncbi:MAG: hypothetical protein ATN31_08215 [Candidatus Epulonipiscioides saccharophilum]|nr:MAG: hypothetical protein ATN31_08215 [Epulopiscium sp. AS2M-Bin001]